jgi:glucosamine--fructose-6-phosphate aminotransferase (isomerizing)
LRENFVVRCNKCILPHGFPNLHFDENGTCSFCSAGVGIARARPGLPTSITEARKIILALSGGRDSCYGLDFLTRNTHAEIIAFTYDWPLVHSRARRNASRMVSVLEIEHVLRAPNSFQHLKFIRKVVNAISKHPDARVIPLLLAPDKFFFSEAEKVRAKYGADVIVFCAGNDLEFTAFKSGVAGAQTTRPEEMLEMSRLESVKFLFSLFSCYLQNPRLFLAGIRIPVLAFLTTYLFRPKIEYLFQYIDWDESQIEKVLADFGWEGPKNPSSRDSWRSGDGTVTFYNYLYFQLLGFNERTTHLSNKIRAGLISREDALKLEELNNSPDIEGLREYAAQIGFQLDEFLREFNGHLN